MQSKATEKARENNKTMKVNCIKNTAERVPRLFARK